MMLDVIDNILKNSRAMRQPPGKLRHIWSYPELPIAGVCDFMYYDLYESDTTDYYVLRQSDGVLGEIIWYKQNETANAGSVSADASQSYEKNP